MDARVVTIVVLLIPILWCAVGLFFFFRAEKEGFIGGMPEMVGIGMGAWALAGPFAYFLLRFERRR